MSKMKKLKKIGLAAMAAVVLGIVMVVVSNAIVIAGSSSWIIDAEKSLPSVEAIIVPGSFVWADGRPSWILKDRLDTGLELYTQNPGLKIIVSGDHGRTNYDEVNAMRTYLEERGVPTKDIYMDHAGFSTYETLYRARDIFKVNSVVVVTQGYHLKRAVYIGNHMGITTYGVGADKRQYAGMKRYLLREYLARTKDLMCVDVFKPAPAYLGAAIPIQQMDGTVTHDQD